MNNSSLITVHTRRYAMCQLCTQADLFETQDAYLGDNLCPIPKQGKFTLYISISVLPYADAQKHGRFADIGRLPLLFCIVRIKLVVAENHTIVWRLILSWLSQSLVVQVPILVVGGSISIL